MIGKPRALPWLIHFSVFIIITLYFFLNFFSFPILEVVLLSVETAQYSATLENKGSGTTLKSYVYDLALACISCVILSIFNFWLLVF